jgi:putative phosphoribosyl transferase
LASDAGEEILEEMRMTMPPPISTPPHLAAEDFRLPTAEGDLGGALTIPPAARGIVLFAHGSGSSRHSPRNRFVAGVLQQAGLATLLMDLLTRQEEAVDQLSREYRFDIGRLARRLAGAIDWLAAHPGTRQLPAGLFGASTGAAAALIAAAERPTQVRAVVSRGGRPDLAGDALPRVTAPTLLIVGADDTPVIPLNTQALDRMQGLREMALVEGATHLFEEPGTLEEASHLARDWFLRYLPGSVGGSPGALERPPA